MQNSVGVASISAMVCLKFWFEPELDLVEIQEAG
jgi:hypothetical protein